MKKILCIFIFTCFYAQAETEKVSTEAAVIESATAASMGTLESTTEAARAIAGVIENTQEKDIPLKFVSEKKEAASDLSLQKFMIGAAVLCLLLGGIYFFVRKYTLKTRKSDLHQMKILSQFHLGPRKSLAIVRVAGESILIGVTDHNISMLKSLSLLDEDIPEDVPQKFDQVIQEIPKTKPEEDEFAFRGIHDLVKNKLKSMKGFPS